MPLTGVDPNDPTPSNRRELIFAAGPGTTSNKERLVLIYGNKTSAGSETVDKISTPVLDDDDAIARFGRRSEWYNMYRKYVPVDSAATIYGVAPTEAAGTAASCTFTFASNATDASTVEITGIGEKVEAAVASGDTPTVIAAAVSAAINAAAEGTWPFTASPAAGVVTVTAANLGPRGDLIIGNASDRGLRMRFTKSVTTTIVKSALTGGTVEDDFTAAYAEAANGEYYYQCSPKHATATVTATDNGIGEHIEMIKTQALPVNGKGQCANFGLVGTQAQATAVGISSAANSVRGFFWHQEDNDWTPGMLAAHHTAVMRSQQVRHPCANLAGYRSSDSTIYQVPAPYNKDDVPTATELKADLNNGISSVSATTTGTTYIVRHITSRSLNAQGSQDYKAREGHITSGMDFFWETVNARWLSERQEFVDDDPPAGGKPLPNTSTPGQLKGIISSVIDDLCGPRPLGLYEGPILKASALTAMKNSIVVLKIPGGLSASANVQVVEHMLKSEHKYREVSAAY